MDGSFLRFYVHENDRLHGRLAWEWLLAQANELGIRGGSAFRAVAGFGRLLGGVAPADVIQWMVRDEDWSAPDPAS